MSTTMQGTRVLPDEHGWLDDKAMLKPGAYGQATNPRVVASGAGYWQITTPDGHVGSLNPDLHTVIEHEDGTITVSPSIDMSKRTPGAYHGWLRNGVWTSV